MTEQPVIRERFSNPDVFSERGEFARTAEALGVDESVLLYLAQENGSLVHLDEEMWARLENTDSYEITTGDWEEVARLAQMVGRNYEDIRTKLEQGATPDAPIVANIGGTLHLVSGNTRLMVARAAGITPSVFLFTVDIHE